MQKEEKVKVLMDQLKIDKQKYDAIREEERLADHKELSPEEQKKVLTSPGFNEFFGKASRMVERALNQSIYDFTVNYSEEEAASGKRGTGLQCRSTCQDKRVSSRAVTSIDWSHKHPELLLSSYAGQDNPMSLDPDGAVYVWNMHVPTRPEFSFNCNSAVLAAQFHPTHPNLVVGACQSGQVVLWDMREKNTPVNRTSLSHGHTHPVYSLDTLAVVNKLHNIVSMSTDGQLCIWSDNTLHSPAKEIKMSYGKDEITTTSFAFTKNLQSLLIGSDEGWLYKAHMYDNEGIYDATQAHKAPITSVRIHPSQKNNNLADLYLTSSFDWTVKLWSDKGSRPLLTFESARDYVFDVQWSPVHPALFAMGDGGGRLDLWNINRDTDVPILTTHVDSAVAIGDKASISRVAWSHSGNQIAVGTSSGALHIYEVREEDAQPGPEDAASFYEKMQKRQTAI